VDAATSQQYVLGAHSAPVKCVEWLPERGAVVTAGWDATLRLWDPRLPPQSCNVATAELPGKAYALGRGEGKLVVGTAGRHVLIYDTSL
jgi:WD40 repeat protein